MNHLCEISFLISNAAELALAFGLFLVFQLPGMWEPLQYILRNRLNLDLVPDNIRNAIYSLLPTLTILIGIPGTLLGGYCINEFEFPPTNYNNKSSLIQSIASTGQYDMFFVTL